MPTLSALAMASATCDAIQALAPWLTKAVLDISLISIVSISRTFDHKITYQLKNTITKQIREIQGVSED